MVIAGSTGSGGCGFSIPTEDELDPADPVDPADPSDPLPVTRMCDLGDDSLRLCIDFEDTPNFAEDGSGRGHDAATTAVAVTTRGAENAVLVGAGSRILIPEHPDLDIENSLTVLMWMRADAYTGTTQYLLDNNRQYAISYQANGRIRCGLNTVTLDSAVSYFDGAWHHVACTFDGQQLKVLIDGNVQGCRSASSIPTNGEEGISIGANVDAGPTYSNPFIGGLDNVQVFARAWTDDQVCAANGRTGCSTSCGYSYGGN